jgi:cation transport ATPase
MNTVVLDKTGTITRGQPAVTDVVVNGFPGGATELLRLAASVEKGSEHPLGEAIVAEAGNRDLVLSEPEGFQAEVGHGVQAQVDGSWCRWATCAWQPRNLPCRRVGRAVKCSACKAKPRTMMVAVDRR